MAEAALFGGPIRPLYEGTPPRWLVLGDPELRNPWGIRDLGDQVRRLTEEGNILPYGSNYAVHAVEQRRFRYTRRSVVVRTVSSSWVKRPRS